jgi:type VI secretion system secreted protein Hcp
MPIAIKALTSQPGGEGADAFLYVKAKRAGVIKGESQATGYVGQIDVRGWHWGASAASAIGHTVATSRRSYTGLTVVKKIDLATTPLMSALATNDEVTEAKLSLRRAGGDQELYFTITLKSARVTAVEHHFDSAGDTTESVTFVFTKVEVEYTPQKSTGQRGGSTTFTDELTDS